MRIKKTFGRDLKRAFFVWNGESVFGPLKDVSGGSYPSTLVKYNNLKDMDADYTFPPSKVSPTRIWRQAG